MKTYFWIDYRRDTQTLWQQTLLNIQFVYCYVFVLFFNFKLIVSLKPPQKGNSSTGFIPQMALNCCNLSMRGLQSFNIRLKNWFYKFSVIYWWFRNSSNPFFKAFNFSNNIIRKSLFPRNFSKSFWMFTPVKHLPWNYLFTKVYSREM